MSKLFFRCLNNLSKLGGKKLGDPKNEVGKNEDAFYFKKEQSFYIIPA